MFDATFHALSNDEELSKEYCQAQGPTNIAGTNGSTLGDTLTESQGTRAK
jgi:hypothetical protein